MFKRILFISILLLFQLALHALDLDSMIKSVSHLPASDKVRLKQEATIAWYMMGSDIEKSIAMSANGKKQSKKIKNPALQYRFIVTEATAYQMSLNFSKSIALFEEAIELCKKEKKDSWVANCYGNLANTYFKMSDYQNSIEANLKGIEVARRSTEPISWGSCYQTIAACYARMNDTLIAIKYTKLSFGDTLMTVLDVANGYTNLANIYSSYNQLDSAKKYIDLMGAHRKANNLTDPYMMIEECMSNIDYDFASKKVTYRTKEFVDKAIEYSNATGDSLSISVSYNNLAKYFTHSNQYDSSIFYALKAFGYVKNSKDFFTQKIILEVLMKNYSAQKSYKKAFYYTNLLKNVSDSFYVAQNAEAVRDAEIRFDTKQKEEKNQLLERENKVKTQEKNLFLFGGLGIAGLLSLFLWFAVRSRKKTESLNETIEEQNKDLEDSNTTKDKIFRIISHDLRAPIAGLQSLIHLKDSGVLPDEKVTEIDTQIKSSLQNTSGALDNLLVWSIGQLKNEGSLSEQFDINETIQSQIDLLQPQCEAKDIEVRFNVNQQYTTKNDRNGVAVIVRNLLNNAIKYSKHHATIEVSLEESGANQFMIAVKDNGVGMTEEQITQYAQGKLQSTSGTSAETGTGLGFLIIKDYCKKMNGTIDIQSEVGKGSEFVFRF